MAAHTKVCKSPIKNDLLGLLPESSHTRKRQNEKINCKLLPEDMPSTRPYWYLSSSQVYFEVFHYHTLHVPLLHNTYIRGFKTQQIEQDSKHSKFLIPGSVMFHRHIAL